MTLSPQSVAKAVRSKASRAHRKVQEAEHELHAANTTLIDALPRHDERAIEDAARRTMKAESAVHSASEELEVVSHLLDDTTSMLVSPSGASGEGLQSLVERLRQV
jgi:predicted transcriptional regulator